MDFLSDLLSQMKRIVVVGVTEQYFNLVIFLTVVSLEDFEIVL